MPRHGLKCCHPCQMVVETMVSSCGFEYGIKKQQKKNRHSYTAARLEGMGRSLVHGAVHGWSVEVLSKTPVSLAGLSRVLGKIMTTILQL